MWDGDRYNARDKSMKEKGEDCRVKAHSTADLMRWFEKSDNKRPVMITTHPQRWANNTGSWSAQKKIDPLVITTAEGIYFTDEDGKRYADMSSQLVNVNLGHHNEALIAAIKEQADKLAFIGPSYATDVRSEAAKGIADLSGIPGAKVFFTNAGAESNENAIKLAKLYTGKWKILSMQRCYHGSTAGAGGLSGEPRHFANEPGDAGHVIGLFLIGLCFFSVFHC